MAAFIKGEHCTYSGATNPRANCQVVEVHFDEGHYSYTVRLDDSGREINTIESRLKKGLYTGFGEWQRVLDPTTNCYFFSNDMETLWDTPEVRDRLFSRRSNNNNNHKEQEPLEPYIDTRRYHDVRLDERQKVTQMTKPDSIRFARSEKVGEVTDYEEEHEPLVTAAPRSHFSTYLEASKSEDDLIEEKEPQLFITNLASSHAIASSHDLRMALRKNEESAITRNLALLGIPFEEGDSLDNLVETLVTGLTRISLTINRDDLNLLLRHVLGNPKYHALAQSLAFPTSRLPSQPSRFANHEALSDLYQFENTAVAKNDFDYEQQEDWTSINASPNRNTNQRDGSGMMHISVPPQLFYQPQPSYDGFATTTTTTTTPTPTYNSAAKESLLNQYNQQAFIPITAPAAGVKKASSFTNRDLSPPSRLPPPIPKGVLKTPSRGNLINNPPGSLSPSLSYLNHTPMMNHTMNNYTENSFNNNKSQNMSVKFHENEKEEYLFRPNASTNSSSSASLLSQFAILDHPPMTTTTTTTERPSPVKEYREYSKRNQYEAPVITKEDYYAPLPTRNLPYGLSEDDEDHNNNNNNNNEQVDEEEEKTPDPTASNLTFDELNKSLDSLQASLRGAGERIDASWKDQDEDRHQATVQVLQDPSASLVEKSTNNQAQERSIKNTTVPVPVAPKPGKNCGVQGGCVLS